MEELVGMFQVQKVTTRRLLRLGKPPSRKYAKKWYISEQVLAEHFQHPEPLEELEGEEAEPKESGS